MIVQLCSCYRDRMIILLSISCLDMLIRLQEMMKMENIFISGD
jgi:hypothetical protein